MENDTSDDLPQNAARTGSRTGMPEPGRVGASTALADCDRHGDALFSLALLLCRDVDRAVEAVVATVTQSCATASDAMPEAKRQSLAADMWHRYAGDLAPRPQHPDLVLPSGVHSAGPSRQQEQALLGLILFGCHTYGQAAALIGVSVPSAAAHLRSVLRRASSLI